MTLVPASTPFSVSAPFLSSEPGARLEAPWAPGEVGAPRGSASQEQGGVVAPFSGDGGGPALRSRLRPETSSLPAGRVHPGNASRLTFPRSPGRPIQSRQPSNGTDQRECPPVVPPASHRPLVKLGKFASKAGNSISAEPQAL